MNAIKNNPYRTLGLFGNSTEKELQKQITILKRFAEIGKNRAFEFDFPFLGDIVRSSETVQEAASKIEQAKNKVHFALFWFLNSGHIDEVALNYLKEGNLDKANDIWEKALRGSIVTDKNFTAICNISTLQLGIVTNNGSFDSEKFTESIELKGKLLLSEAASSFITTVIGEGNSINRDTILKDFVNEIMQIIRPYLNKTNGLKSTQLIDAFRTFPDDIRRYISSKFTDRPLISIENKIEKTNQKRSAIPKGADRYGKELFTNTKEELVILKSIWSINNVQYQIIVNKLVKEIFQCAIDYFVEYRDSDEYDPGERAMVVMKIAKALNPTGQTKNRLEDNIENLQDWIDNSEERNKKSLVKSDIEFIYDKLEEFQNLPVSISNAKYLVVTCNPKLENIQLALGANDNFYIEISSSIVNNALNSLISIMNNEMKGLQSSDSTLLSITAIITGAMVVINMMANMAMNKEIKSHFNQNKIIISDIQSKLNAIYEDNNSSSSGCYVATMVYGSYDHPKVLKLREFRDHRLSKLAVGRLFIHYYYQHSPRLTNRLKDNQVVNKIIKSVLNIIIRIIK